MIERQEARLVRACSDLLDVMNRPGPGLLIRLPLFVEKSLRLVLARRRWAPTSLWPLPQATDRRLEATIRTCDRKVTAHLDRLALFRKQIASARLIQGALAAGRAAGASEEHESQRFDQEALDHFRAVLALPGQGRFDRARTHGAPTRAFGWPEPICGQHLQCSDRYP